MLPTKDLFGGAIKLHVPDRFLDVSRLRDVPNNQEVFADTEKDESIIVELLEYVDKGFNDEQAARFHWSELAELNQSDVPQIVFQKALTFGAPNTDLPLFPREQVESAYLIVGEQRVAKFKENASNLVSIFMCLVRLHRVGTDMIVSLNAPYSINPQSSSAKAVYTTANSSVELGLFEHMLHTLQVADWGLFGG